MWLLLLLLLRHPSRGDRDRTVLVEWRVVEMVAALVWKVASWREWSDCWRRGVNGVIVEMLAVAMFVVVLCTKITIGKEKRLTEDHSNKVFVLSSIKSCSPLARIPMLHTSHSWNQRHRASNLLSRISCMDVSSVFPHLPSGFVGPLLVQPTPFLGSSRMHALLL